MYSLCRQKKFRTVTSPLRKLPDFVIIGAAKSGTTSLYDFMTKHPRSVDGMRRFSILFMCLLTWRKQKLDIYCELDRILLPAA